jgi:hypothetical protein
MQVVGCRVPWKLLKLFNVEIRTDSMDGSITHEQSCSTNNSSITLSPPTSQEMSSGMVLSSNIVEIIVFAKQVAVNIFQNVHPSSGAINPAPQQRNMFS